MATYTSEIMTVENRKTGKLSYFLKVCDVWRKEGRLDQVKRFKDANRASCMVTTRDAKYTRHYTTLHFEFDLNIDKGTN